jgi:hypothetical protein
MSDGVRDAVERLVQARTVGQQDEAWDALRPLGPVVVPYLVDAYPTARRAEARTALVYHCIRYARTSEEAFQLGLLALNDRARPVRHRACGLLAYSLRHDALPALRLAAQHQDIDTATEARAAIRAIEGHDHHLYIDRSGSGRSFWVVNLEDDQSPLKPEPRPNGVRRLIRKLRHRRT